MTRKELRENILAIENTNHIDFSRYGTLGNWKTERFMQLIDQWSEEIINTPNNGNNRSLEKLYDQLISQLVPAGGRAVKKG